MLIHRNHASNSKSKKSEIAVRIEWLGMMSQRRKDYTADRNLDGLLALADEYAEHPHMQNTAAIIRVMVSEMRITSPASHNQSVDK